MLRHASPVPFGVVRSDRSGAHLSSIHPAARGLGRTGKRDGSLFNNRTVTGYVLAVGAPVILLLLRMLLKPVLTDSGPLVFFTPAIMVSAWYGGLGPGLVATALGALLSDYFFIGPIGFVFDSTSVARLLVFVLV